MPTHLRRVQFRNHNHKHLCHLTVLALDEGNNPTYRAHSADTDS